MMWCWCGTDVAQQEHDNIKLYASAFRYVQIWKGLCCRIEPGWLASGGKDSIEIMDGSD